MASNKTLLPVVILAPPGRLGLEIAPANKDSNDYVWVGSVDPTGPLSKRVKPGDIIARVNNVCTKGKDVNFVCNLLNSDKRFMTLLREKDPTPTSPVRQKENTANASKKVAHATNAALKKPPPNNIAASDASKEPPPVNNSQMVAAPQPTGAIPPASAQASRPPIASIPVTPMLPPPTHAMMPTPNVAGAIIPMPTPPIALPFPAGKPQPLSNNVPTPMQPTMNPIKTSAAGATSSLKRPAATSNTNTPATDKQPKKKKAKKSTSSSMPDLEMIDDIPDPGFVCKHEKFYSTLNNETLVKVAEKLGTDWKTLANLRENTSRYGRLGYNSVFKPGTLLYIPKKRSAWRMKQLKKKEIIETEECTICGIESNPAEMLMCDGCDAPCHVKCAELTAVPEGDWFCDSCLEILRARTKYEGKELVHQLPPLPPLVCPPDYRQLEAKLRVHLQKRRSEALANLDDYNRATRGSFQERERELNREIARIQSEINSAKTLYSDALHSAMRQQTPELEGWNTSSYYTGQNWIQIRENGRTVRLNQKKETVRRGVSWRDRDVMSARWERAIAARTRVYSNADVKRLDRKKATLEKLLSQTKQSLSDSQRESKGLTASESEEEWRLKVEYASLLNEGPLNGETQTAFKRREAPPRFVGRVLLKDDADVLAMNMLLEPDELILLVPVGNDIDFEPQVGRSYGIFVRMPLFDKKRDDELPMEHNGVRDAQRRLFSLLSSNEANQAMIVTRPSVPPTVRPRSNSTGGTQCFDLSELVRDCNVDLDLPKEPTPSSMATNGLELRGYQQSSLRWLLDKEKETTGLGLAGEFWHRLRFLDPNASVEFFYCELTGTFALDIFNFRGDVEQKDASLNRFAMPTGGVLGEEMGCGKTVECIALIIQNPPPLHNRVLPREHVWSLEKKTTVDHPDYVPLPNVGGTTRISNGTLIVVPMTLLSQWQNEIEKFAPHLNVMTLHNAENPTIQAIATSDVVIASTSLLQPSGHQKPGKGSKTKGSKGDLLRQVKRIHWHRLIVDEAHYNQQGSKIKPTLSALSATHRLSVTGTPIGSELSDLQGQLRFLRLAPFNRTSFWKNNIEDPYYERNPESLRVLRSLLSHVVVRHAKEQTFANGTSLLSLPPRTVETVLLEWGSEAEKNVYESIEARNQLHFMKLKQESLATVASRYLALNGLLTFARQACAHGSLVSVQKLHDLNTIASEDKKKKKKEEEEEIVAYDKTREGILKSALSKARNSAKLRMRVAVNQFQSPSEMLECPVCLECIGEAEIALPACAHPLCQECVISILDGGSSIRDASGHCPTCRDVMRRSEITFLGEAADAGTTSKDDVPMGVKEEDSKLPAVCSVNGFQVTASSANVSVAGASTLRAKGISMPADELRRTLREDRAYLSTLKEGFLRSYYDSRTKVGTKVCELLLEIEAMASRDSSSKCVVFSQFIGVLDVASEELQARGIGFVRLDCSCKQHERADALLEFSSNSKVKVFLLSMRSGAVGLTLTAADHCFIMDIAQNSAIEEQAIDRIHRIGQTRPVTVKRFVIRNTVEERLLGVRRSLGVDRTAGTQICGASVLAGEEKLAAKTDKRRASKDDILDDTKRQMRVETLETLFGCGKGKVHKA